MELSRSYQEVHFKFECILKLFNDYFVFGKGVPHSIEDARSSYELQGRIIGPCVLFKRLERVITCQANIHFYSMW
jgi:hypothetical protein